MKYISHDDIISIHDRIIKNSGGLNGIRDHHLLHSMAERPKMQFGGKDLYPTIFDKAAAYFDSCAHHHVFADGNKRTAVTVAARFLFLNGLVLNLNEGEIYGFVVKAIMNKYNIVKVSKWLKSNSTEVRAREK